MLENPSLVSVHLAMLEKYVWKLFYLSTFILLFFDDLVQAAIPIAMRLKAARRRLQFLCSTWPSVISTLQTGTSDWYRDNGGNEKFFVYPFLFVTDIVDAFQVSQPFQTNPIEKFKYIVKSLAP